MAPVGIMDRFKMLYTKQARKYSLPWLSMNSKADRTTDHSPPILSVSAAAVLSVSILCAWLCMHLTNQKGPRNLGICGSILHLKNHPTVSISQSRCAIRHSESGEGRDNGLYCEYILCLNSHCTERG